MTTWLPHMHQTLVQFLVPHTNQEVIDSSELEAAKQGGANGLTTNPFPNLHNSLEFSFHTQQTERAILLVEEFQRKHAGAKEVLQPALAGLHQPRTPALRAHTQSELWLRKPQPRQRV